MRTISLLPELTQDEYQSLKADIEKNGILVPIIRTESGETIDGHHREKIAAELGIEYPVETISDRPEEERRHMAISLNANRRQLSVEQKRNLILDELVRSPDISNNWLAELLGVDDKTVQAVRLKAETTDTIPKVTEFRCKDGKKRKYRRPTQQEQQVITEAKLQETPALLSICTTSQDRQAAVPPVQRLEPTTLAVPTGDDIQIIQGDFRTLDIAPGSAKLVLTDPPYDRDSIPLWDDLAILAEKLLVDGGVLLAYTGTMFLPETIAALSKTLKYRWTLATFHEGPTARIHSLNMTTGWSPVVMFTKGKYLADYAFLDTIHGAGQEKKYHPWQKPLAEVEQLIETFTRPGDLVIDPFGGSFTTAVACKSQGRRCISCDIDQACVATGHERMKETDLGKFEAA